MTYVDDFISIESLKKYFYIYSVYMKTVCIDKGECPYELFNPWPIILSFKPFNAT